MTILVDTNSYRRSHGKEPRGFGLWIFSAGHKQCDIVNSVQGFDWMQVSANYADAKRSAKAWAKGRGFALIDVCP